MNRETIAAIISVGSIIFLSIFLTTQIQPVEENVTIEDFSQFIDQEDNNETLEEKEKYQTWWIDDVTIYLHEPYIKTYKKTVSPEFRDLTTKDKLKIYISPSEYESTAFSIYANIDLLNLTIKTKDLVNGTKTIHRNNIQLTTVRENYSFSYETSEIELFIDDNYLETINVIVLIPKAQSPGTYKTSLRFYSNEEEIAELPLIVEVLPIELDEEELNFDLQNPSYYYNNNIPSYFTYYNYLNSIEWLGYKENLDDIKYYQKLDSVIQDADKSVTSIGIQNEFSYKFGEIANKGTVSYSEYKELRLWIIEQIIFLDDS